MEVPGCPSSSNVIPREHDDATFAETTNLMPETGSSHDDVQVDEPSETTAAEGATTTAAEGPTTTATEGTTTTDENVEVLQEQQPVDALPQQEPENTEQISESTPSSGAEEGPIEEVEVLTTGDCFQLLDDETIVYIFSFLELPDLVRVTEVCRDFLELGSSDELWIRLYENYNWKYYFTCASQNLDLDWKDLFVARYLQEKQNEDDEGSIPFEQGYTLDDEVEEESDTDDELVEDLNSIDDMLKSNEISLEKLLNADEFISELHRGRPILLQFLKLPNSMDSLIHFVLDDPAPDEPNLQLRKKLAHVAFQALNNDWLLEVLISLHELLDVLLNFLVAKSVNTEPLKSGYFAKLLEVLLDRYPNELVSYLLSRDFVAPALVRHVQDQYIMDTVYKLVDCCVTHQWFHESKVIPLFVAHLHDVHDEAVEEDTAQVTLQLQRGTLMKAKVLINIFTLCQPWAQSVFITDLFNDENVVAHFMSYITREVQLAVNSRRLS